METKIVTKIGILVLIILACSISDLRAQEVIHLSGNYSKQDDSFHKITTSNGTTYFFKGEEQFKLLGHKNATIEIKDTTNLNTKVLTLEKVYDVVLRKRNKSKENGQLVFFKKKILFKTIYLYERESNRIYRHEVTWLDVILD